MTIFGDTLRKFRQASNDPERLNRRLSQERLGELIGRELNNWGYTGAAISDWERGKSRISADDRDILLALVNVFRRCGGIQTVLHANQLLETGNYRPLDQEEIRSIFPDVEDKQSEESADKEGTSDSSENDWFTSMFSVFKTEWNDLLVKAKAEGPEPYWPRVLAALMRKATDPLSLSITTILWVAIWFLTKWLIGPSLRLPFVNYDTALVALSTYASASLVVPLLIGMLVNTRESEYWKQQNGINPCLLRLYTYQGAGIGFNVGYFLVFPWSLLLYYLDVPYTVWIEIAAATVSLLLGNMAARVVPHNLWIAYGRLKFWDGGIFFVVALMGPLWALFFLESYYTLLHPTFGIIVILLALGAVVFFARKRSKRQTE